MLMQDENMPATPADDQGGMPADDQAMPEEEGMGHDHDHQEGAGEQA